MIELKMLILFLLWGAKCTHPPATTRRSPDMTTAPPDTRFPKTTTLL